MRNEQLYIDGELVDLDEDTKITLNIKSNLFTDLSKIVSNNSYTIKLPKTVRNQRIIEHADLPACDTDYPREYHQARYFRNGIEIIPDGKAVLMSCKEDIEIAITWGNIVALSSIIEGDKKLTDLPQISEGGPYEGPDYRLWKDWGENDPDVYPYIDYGFNKEEETVWYHPVEYVSKTMERICESNGVSITFPEEVSDMLGKMFVPLLTRNDSEEFAEMCSIDFIVEGIEYDNIVDQYTLYFEENQASNYYGRADWLPDSGRRTNAYCSFISNGIPKLTGEVEVIIQSSETPSEVVLNVHKENEDNTGANVETDSILEIIPFEISPVEDHEGYYKLFFSFEDEQTSVLDNNMGTTYGYMKFSFAYLPNGGKVISAEGNIKVMNIAEKVMLQNQIGSGTSTREGRFWIVPNLPDIKQIDFIKAIANILGVFAVSDEENNIRFVSFDALYKNVDKALDWTKNVVADTLDNKPKEISYTIDKFAQRNNVKWAEDDTVRGEYDSYIVVDDNTLDYEVDLITLPFAATDFYGGKAKIPLYTYDDSLGIQYNGDLEPRLLLISGNSGTFKGLDWATLISENYASYQKVIRRPVVIKEKIEISDVELREIDVTVPVYLAQYGRYYAIISIKAEDTGICECELLQLEV